MSASSISQEIWGDLETKVKPKEPRESIPNKILNGIRRRSTFLASLIQPHKAEKSEKSVSESESSEKEIDIMKSFEEETND